MLTVYRRRSLQPGDVFRWKNPFYGDNKHNVPDKLHFIAGNRPAIVTKVSNGNVYFYPFRSKVFNHGQVHLIRDSEFNDELKNGVNAIVPEKHMCSIQEFADMVDYYIGSISKAANELVNDNLIMFGYNAEYPSVEIKSKMYNVTPGKIIKMGNKEYLVLSMNGVLINIIPFYKITHVEAVRRGYGIQFLYEDEVNPQYLNYNEYRTISSKSAKFTVIDYIDSDMIPIIYHELVRFTMRMTRLKNGFKYKEAMEKIQDIINSVFVSGTIPSPVIVEPVELVHNPEDDDVEEEVAVEEKQDEKIDVVVEPDPSDTKDKTMIEFVNTSSDKGLVSIKANQLSDLEKLKNELAIQEAEKNQSIINSQKSMNASLLRYGTADEISAFLKLDFNYFNPVNKSRYLKEITTPEELLFAVAESVSNFKERTGKTEAVYNYRRRLILESIEDNAPAIIKKYI